MPSSADDDRGQVVASAAEVYDRFFVPALFAQATGWVLDAADVRPGQRVVDVACGTGVLARAARDRVGRDGAVVGVDSNAGMLTVARERSSDIDWREGRAESLPLPDGDVDAAVSQFGLMFFDDRVTSLAELARVTRPGGRLAAAVWGTLAETPGYDAMAAIVGRLFGADAALSLEAPYALGSPDELRRLAATAGLRDVDVTRHVGTARFGSLDAWVHTDVRGWTLADRVDDAGYERLRRAAAAELGRFVATDGSVSFPTPALVLSASV
jgi:SAM-dependent methyltransferase